MDSLTITDGGSVGAAAHDPAAGPRAARRDLGIAVSERPDVTDSTDRDRELVRDLLEHRRTHGARLPSRRRVETFVDSAVGLLFPQHSADGSATEEQLLARISLLRAELGSMLHTVLPRQRSAEVADELIHALPAISERLRGDAVAIVAGDPAAESLDEVVAAYPGFFAIAVHRIAHELNRLRVPWRYDGDERFPHVYGPLDRRAITEVRTIERDASGAFLPIEHPDHPSSPGLPASDDPGADGGGGG